MTSSRTSAPRFVDSWASVHFDTLRGLAAVFVLLDHWRNLFFVDFPQLVAHRLLLAIPYLLSSAGHQSVVLFFVLSGYFIGGTVFRAVERNQWKWSEYLLRRLVRLWTVLVPALLLCLFWDRLGIHLGRAPALYSGNVPNHMLYAVAPLLTFRNFFGSLFFLQTIHTPLFGSDGALWSLANEFWYYILFPLGLVALWPSIVWRKRLLCATLFLAVAWFVGIDILMYFPIWLAGAALFKIPPPRFPPAAATRLRVAAAILYPVIFFSLAKLHSISSFYKDYLLGAATFAFLWILLSAKKPFSPQARSVRASRELARFSYTLYAVHIPFLVFIASLAVGDTRWYPAPAKLSAALVILFAAFAYTYLLAFITEFRTDALRQRLEDLFGLGAQPAELPSNPLATTLPLATPHPPAPTHPPSVDSTSRIPSLDGLRAFSIFLVLALHTMQRYSVHHPVALGWRVLFSGSTGVFIFFEISGFLITSLLLKEYERFGAISLRSFFIRRAFRILPPLYLYIGVVAVLGLAGRLVLSRADILSSLFFYRNLSLASSMWSLQHLWSISIEEQFYLLWPFLLLFSLRRYLPSSPHRATPEPAYLAAAAIPAIIVLASPVLRIILANSSNSLLHHIGIVDLRYDFLMFGCILALLRNHPRFESVYRSVTYLPWLPPFLLILCNAISVRYKNYFDLSVGYSLAGLAIAFWLLWCVRNPKSIVGRLLNWRPIVYLGTLSYSIYLWQTLFLHIRNPEVFGSHRWVSSFPGNWVSILLVAACSFYFVEQPSRHLRDRVLKGHIQ